MIVLVQKVIFYVQKVVGMVIVSLQDGLVMDGVIVLVVQMKMIVLKTVEVMM